MKISKFLMNHSLILVLSCISLSIVSCNSGKNSQDQPVCDSAAIYKKFQQDNALLIRDSLGAIEKKIVSNLAFKSRSFDSDEILTSTAINEHLAYLKGDLTLRDEQDRIIHYLKVSRKSLDLLNNEGKGGLRLYFSQVTGTGAEHPKFLSLILVPVNTDDDNVIKESIKTCVNTLEPCPDKCALNSAYRGPGSKNSKFDLNYDAANDRWYKPNIDPEKPWVKQDNSEHPKQDD